MTVSNLPPVKKSYPRYVPCVWGEEFWELSALCEKSSYLTEKKISLDKLIPDFPVLFKKIVTKENLSIQVHPNDSQASPYQKKGKDECWFILDSDNTTESGVYIGIKDQYAQDFLQEDFYERPHLDSCLHFFPAQKGNFFNIPAGTLHAIGKNITLLEVQRPSDLTFRLWDWGRKGRERHLKEGIRSLNPFLNQFQNIQFFSSLPPLFSPFKGTVVGYQKLPSSSSFSLIPPQHPTPSQSYSWLVLYPLTQGLSLESSVLPSSVILEANTTYLFSVNDYSILSKEDSEIFFFFC